MGRRARVAPSGPQLVQPGEEAAAAAAELAEVEALKAPEAPEKSEQAEVGQAPAPAEPSPAPVTATTPAVPVRKSIRILTRKDEPKTTPSQQTTEAKTNPTTRTAQAAAIARQTQRTRITIAQLLESPQPTRTTRQQTKTALTTTQLQLHEAETNLQKVDLNGQQHANHDNHKLYETYAPYEQHEHRERDETSEEEQLSKYSTRQHSQRQKKPKQPKQPSSQKKSAKKQHEASNPAIPSVQFYKAGLAPPPATMIVERRIKLVTEQHNIPKAPQVEGYPMKEWTVEVYILDEAGKEKPARCFHKVVYNLHPSFVNPIQTFHEPPFKCTNEGWGEFEMTIDCYTTEKGGKQSILHDLNFASPTYENIHTIQFKNPSQALQAILRETGPLPTDEDRKARKNLDGPGGSGAISKKKKTYDLEKMADAIPRLSEDDLLHVIQLIHDNKNDDTYIMNNPDAGEFSIDLYTMPDNLCRLMWEFLLQSPEGHRLR